jgi:RNA 2',3'-cyclic 3'-phosphodiesterase
MTISRTPPHAPPSYVSPGAGASAMSPSSSTQTTQTTVRLFVAINLPDEVRQQLYDAAAPLRASAPHVSWVPASKLHLTVKFLGDQPAQMVDATESALRAIAARHRPFDLELGGVGAFPNLKTPNVVWAGVSPEPRLELLHHDVELAFQQLGCGLEGRPFRPHITLGRVRYGGGRDEARAVARGVRLVQFHAHAHVRTLDVMESALLPGGAQYQVLRTVELGHSA